MCPHTGLILRRCTLDEEGIAYWENPTYMKCISNDYRSIQTLVSIEKENNHMKTVIVAFFKMCLSGYKGGKFQ